MKQQQNFHPSEKAQQNPRQLYRQYFPYVHFRQDSFNLNNHIMSSRNSAYQMSIQAHQLPQFKMSISDEGALNGGSDQHSQQRISTKKKEETVEEIVHDPHDLLRAFQGVDQAETPTPTKPPVETGPAEGNPEAKAEDVKAAQEGFKMTKKMMKVMVGIIVFILLVGGITALVLFINRSKFTVEIIFRPEPVNLANTESSIQTKIVSAKDPETFNTDAPISITANKVTTSQGVVSNGRFLQEKEQEYAGYTIQDPQTETTVTVSSQDMQIRASFSLIKMLEYVLRAQPLPEGMEEEPPRNLQETDPSDINEETVLAQEFTFYSVADRVAQTLKNSLPPSDKDAQVTQEACFDLKHNKDINAFEFIKEVAKGAIKAAVLHDPKTTPVIKDFKNETEVGEVVAKVAIEMIRKGREFFKKRLPQLQAAANVELPPADPSNGTPSIYIDQAQDMGKLCDFIDGSNYRCDGRIISSDLINVASPDPTANIQPLPIIVVRTTAIE